GVTETRREKDKTWFSPCLRASMVDSLSQFQRCQRKQRKNQRCNPEAHNHFRLRPAQQLEMMVNRRHLENTFLTQLVGTNLQDHRKCLDNENTSDERQQQFLLDHNGYGADRAAER